MTLDEAVKNMEMIAEENQRVIDTGIVFGDITIDMLYCDDTEVIDEHLAYYQETAENYRQIAEWLKELKQLREQSCDNCISRQAAIDEIEYELEMIDSALVKKTLDFNTRERLRQREGEAREILNSIQMLPSVQPKKGRWIPCSERLPNRDEYIKNNGLFIVTDGNRTYSEWYDIYDKQGFGEPTMSGFRIDHVVTAWMPLPEPCKEEEDGTN